MRDVNFITVWPRDNTFKAHLSSLFGRAKSEVHTLVFSGHWLGASLRKFLLFSNFYLRKTPFDNIVELEEDN